MGRGVLLKHWPRFSSDGCGGQELPALKHALSLWAADTYLEEVPGFPTAEGKLSPRQMYTGPYGILCPMWDPQGISCHVFLSEIPLLHTCNAPHSQANALQERGWTHNLQSPLPPSREQNGRTDPVMVKGQVKLSIGLIGLGRGRWSGQLTA